MVSLLGIVPARGGSKRLRRKNLLPLNGKPLCLIAAEHLSVVCDRVVISTDDIEIKSVALAHGFEVHNRDMVDDEQTVAECAAIVVKDLGWEGDVLLLQPTVPYPGDFEGMTSWSYIESGAKAFTQDTASPTGIYYWPAGTVGEFPDSGPVAGWVPESAGLDIDTVEDYQTAVLRSRRKRIVIEYAHGDPHLGTGHKHRAMTLAAALQHHDVQLYNSWPGTDPLPEKPYDLWISDVLDTANRPSYAPLWVTFEDHSRASRQADLVVNALYPPARMDGYSYAGCGNVRTGPDWAVLRPEFLSLPDFEVRDFMHTDGSMTLPKALCMFGGTDPADLGLLALAAIGNWDPTLVKPGDDVPVAATMRNHDLLITSAGRTVYEAAAVGIPTVVLAQNNREATHVHLGAEHGNIYLGLGRLVTAEKLRHTVEQVAGDVELRRELSATARASVDGKGLDRIVSEIDRLLEGL